MLRRRARRAAQARLPAVAAPSVRAHEPAVQAQADEPWPEVSPQAGSSLWLCLSFIPLDTENKGYLSDKATVALARRAWRYTPVVSCGEGMLFLEIAGSLRLFGGLQALRERLQADFRPEGYGVVLACAPSPRAAEWLARAEQQIACVAEAELRGAIAGLPLSATVWPVKVQRMLTQAGLRTVGCCLRMSRDGFARRAGKACLQELDEALGRRPQLLQRFAPPLRFRRRLELEAETLDCELLLAAAETLFAKLGRFLQRRQAVIDGFVLVLGYAPGYRNDSSEVQSSEVHSSVVLRIGTGRPCMQADVFAELTALRFEQLQLAAPVTCLQLSARASVRPPDNSPGLPGIPAAGNSSGDPEQQARLLARLRARLGEARVYGVTPVAEHRPERAWQAAESPARYRVADSAPQLQQALRPLWLLAEPRRIPAPVAGGLSPRFAERIESGWWDGHDVRRDYYRIERADGSCWWVYQDCRNKHWYLHGLFG